MSRNDIIAAARGMIGTPFLHQGRAPGLGLDCIGLVLVTARKLGLSEFEFDVYPRLPSGDRLLEAARAIGLIETAPAQAGDVLCLSFDRDPQHLGFLTSRGILHASERAGGVVEHRLDATWRSRIITAFRFEGIE